MSYPCGHCRDAVPHLDLLYRVDWCEDLVCGRCQHERRVDDLRASFEANRASETLALDGTWDSEAGKFIKAQRNAKLDASRWTIDLDSPLSEECRAEWLNYRRALNRMTVDHAVASWSWPQEPNLSYA